MDVVPYALWAGEAAFGYVLSLLIEGCVLGLGLSARHPRGARLSATVWLTSCTYPLVAVFFPLVLAGQTRATLLLVSETYAPLVEAVLFATTYDRETPRRERLRNAGVVVAANLASFGLGELLQRTGLWPTIFAG